MKANKEVKKAEEKEEVNEKVVEHIHYLSACDPCGFDYYYNPCDPCGSYCC